VKAWVDDTLKLRPPVSGAALRVGLWLEELRSLPFAAEAIQSIRKTAGLELTTVFVSGSATPHTGSASGIAYRLYHRWNRRIAGAENPLRETDLRPLLDGVTIRLENPSAAAGLDVLISLGIQPRHGDCAGLARYGVWSLGFGDPARSLRLPFYFWEILRRDTVNDLTLYVHASRLESGRGIYRYQCKTLPTWYFAHNATECLNMAPVILIRRLLDVQQRGWEALTDLPGWREEEVHLEPRRGYPGAWTLFRFLLGQAALRVRHRLFSKGEAKWFICHRHDRAAFTTHQPRFRADGFIPIPNPAHSTFADPFLMERQGRVYLFVEEIANANNLGHLAACELLPQGPSEFRDILQKPYHLSYPCLVEWKGEVYMIPESGGNYTLELYRATSFPYAWQFEKMLLRDIALVDTTPFFQDGIWYFFTTTVEVITCRWLETWLFWSDSLDGEWHYHPANPICSDVRRARSAGHLFHRNGKLIRPAQDCSVRYGYALVLNEVLKLSPTEYEERQQEVILPDWMPGIFATHTLNFTPNVEVIDATRIPERRP